MGGMLEDSPRAIDWLLGRFSGGRGPLEAPGAQKVGNWTARQPEDAETALGELRLGAGRLMGMRAPKGGLNWGNRPQWGSWASDGGLTQANCP